MQHNKKLHLGTMNIKIHKKSRYKIVGHFPSTLAEYPGKTVMIHNLTHLWKRCFWSCARHLYKSLSRNAVYTRLHCEVSRHHWGRWGTSGCHRSKQSSPPSLQTFWRLDGPTWIYVARRVQEVPANNQRNNAKITAVNIRPHSSRYDTMAPGRQWTKYD